jgi:hypothetical protein
MIVIHYQHFIIKLSYISTIHELLGDDIVTTKIPQKTTKSTDPGRSSMVFGSQLVDLSLLSKEKQEDLMNLLRSGNHKLESKPTSKQTRKK